MRIEVVIVTGRDLSVAESSGSATYMRNLIKQLKRKEIGVTLLSPAKQGFTEKQIVMPYPGKSNFNYLVQLFLLVPFLKLPKNSIIHVHRADEALPFLLFRIRHPVILTLHGTSDIQVDLRRGRIFGSFFRLSLRFALRALDASIAVDTISKGKYEKMVPKAPSIRHIPVGVDTKIFHSGDRSEERKKLGIRLGTPVILFVGRLYVEKGIDILLEAFKVVRKEIPDVELVMIGDGMDRKKIDSIINEENIQGVHMPGSKPPEEVASYMRASNVLALTSITEGMPTVVLEALSSGIPVVSTDVGDVRLVITKGTTGEICTDREPNTVSKHLISVLSNSAQYPSVGCLKAAKPYSWDSVVERIVEVYNEFLQAR